MKYVHSPRYRVDIGGHTFPTAKFGRAEELLLADETLKRGDRLEPDPPSTADLRLAHAADWVDRVLGGKLTLAEQMLIELPWSPAVAEAHALSVSGTILACRLALDGGLGLHLGGGSHHAFAGHGEGFCIFNDLACGIRAMRKEKRIRRALVVDLDVHQGNGTADIFAKDEDVFTFSMHQGDIYPPVKARSTRDIELKAGIRDAAYLELLAGALPGILDGHEPELVVYQAGVDVYERDALGGLRLTRQGIAERDRLVFSACFERRIPVALTLGGGYAQDPEETAELHAQTVREALRLSRAGSKT